MSASTTHRRSEVIVGYDGTSGSEAAVRAGLREAHLRGDDLRVVAVFRSAPYVGMVPGLSYEVPMPDASVTGHLRESSESALASARVATGVTGAQVKAVIDVGPGDPATALVTAGALADLLVIGARRHGSFVSAMLGSATNYVLHHVQCPLLIVPADAPDSWRRVVVGVDGSDCSVSALHWAAATAARHGCPLEVVHGWEFVPPSAWAAPVSGLDPETYDKEIEEWLHGLVHLALGDGDQAVTVRSVQERAAAALHEAAGPEDLLVVGSRGHGLMGEAFLGSVSSSCVHHARGSVAVLRAGGGPTA